ncbi:MAG: hypothetical protein KKE29_12860 [Proteobacteria bacterium]|nr:hypothetical protein [Pseudomonadota bacterium]MBU4599076.1 hypothetical protein [Pseudomonadota bacterium]MBV1714871.1 hypothetical protein [Desulfarculus sp.]
MDELGLRDPEVPPLRRGLDAAKEFITGLPQQAAKAGMGLLDYLGETMANVPGDTRKVVEDSVWLPAQIVSAVTAMGPEGFARQRALDALTGPGGLANIDITEIPGALVDHYKRYVTHPLDTFKEHPIETVADLLPVAALGGTALKAGKAGLQAARRSFLTSPDTTGYLKGKLGTAAEALGSDAYGSIFMNKAKDSLARKAMRADTGRLTLEPWVRRAAQKIPGVTPEAGLNAAQRIRDMAAGLNENLGRKMGLTPKELQEAAILAEAIPNDWAKLGGVPGKVKTRVLRGGVQDPKTKTWRHGLDPDAFNERFAAMRPEAQRLVLEFVAPEEGFRTGVFGPERVLLGSATGPELPLPKGGSTTISRSVAFDEAERLGLLNPSQRAEGYVRRVWDNIIPDVAPKGAPTLTLEPFRPGFTKKRTGQADVGRLDEAISTYRGDLEAAKLNREMLKELGEALLEPYENGDPVVRYRQVMNPATRMMETRAERQTLVHVRPEEAKALGLEKAGKYAIPSAFEERFNLLLGRVTKGTLDTPLEGLGDLLKDAARYWQTNVLLAPGTVGTNLISGLGQYSGKVFEDLARPDGLRRTVNNARGLVGALSPTNWKRYPAETLGANIRTQFAGDTARLFSRVAARAASGQPVSLPAKVLGRLDQALGAAMNIGMQPFGKVENYLKRSIVLSELRTWAEKEVKGLKLTGKAQRAKIEDLMTGAFQQRPEVFKDIMLGPVDRFAFDYDNIPARLDKWRKSAGGSLLMPFMVYPYKYARMLGSQAKAFNPLVKMPVRERVARAAGLTGAAGAPWAIREMLAGGDSKILADQERFREEIPDAEVPGARVWGREYLGKADDGKSEVFLRTVKYPYWNLPIVRRGTESLIEALEEFKTKGPLLSPLFYILGHRPKLGPQKFSEQMGEVAKSAIPFFRALEYIARANDTDAEGKLIQRQPHGFGEQIKEAIPTQLKSFMAPFKPLEKIFPFVGTRDDLAERIDWRGNQQPLRQEPGVEALKFWTGINLKVEDLARHNLTVHKAVRKYSRAAIKDEEVASYVSQWLLDMGLKPDHDKIKGNMPKLHRVSDNMLRSELGRVDENVLESFAHRQGFDLFDAEQQETIGVRMDQWNRLAKNVKGAMAAGQLGIQPNEALNGLVGFGKLIRLYGIREWVHQHPEMLSR